jgi:hypothetical protein
MSEILFEGMNLRAKNITAIRRRGNAIFYRDPAGAWCYLFGYKELADAKFGRAYLVRELKKKK